VAAVDYRLSGEARFPAPLEDVCAAVGWIRDHAAAYGLDADRVFCGATRPAAISRCWPR
jgi:acetyl esterase/lipase